MKKIILLALVFALSSCLEGEAPGSSTTSNDSGGGISNTTGGNGGTTGTTGTTGSGSTTGTTGTDGTTGSTGTSGGFPLHQFDLLLSGHESWVPGNYTDSLAMETQITPQEANILFSSDTRLKLRFRVLPQPNPTSGEKYCYDRTLGQAADAYSYTKLKWRVRLRDILCSQPDPNNTNNCLSGFYLGSPYSPRPIGPVNVDSFSEVIDYGSSRNFSPYGTTVEIDQVYSDNYCLATGSYCPANFVVRRASCWHMTMEVSTDYTQDL